MTRLNTLAEYYADPLVQLRVREYCGGTSRPARGVIDWVRICDTLVRIGFEGWIVLDLSCPPGSVAAHFAAAVRRARELFSTRGKAL